MSKKKKKKSKSEKYVPLYTERDFNIDEKKFNNDIQEGKVDWSTFKRLMINDLCINTNIIDTGYMGDIRIEDVFRALRFPQNNWVTLLKASDILMRISPHYYRLNNLYSNMALFCWWLDLYDVKQNVNVVTLKKSYATLAAKLESMNLKHEFSKIFKTLPYQDIFCGLVVENENDFFIQKIDYRICKLYQIQDGLYNFAINLSRIKPQNLDAYPDYVKQAYIDFTDNKIPVWYLPSADNQICIKMNSQWTYPYPMLISLIRDIFDLDTYKKLKLQSARTDNYKAIMMKVPIDENHVDKPLLTPKVLIPFAEMNRENMTDDIGIIHTLGSGEAISFKDSNNTRNNVSDAVDELYNSSGDTKELFNGSSSATAVTLSVENDSGFVYGVYRQLERWVNRYIKLRNYNKKPFKFSFYLLDITIFNRDTVNKRYKEAISLGATVIDKWLASMDMTPSRMLGSYYVHNEIFDFKNNFVPLSSSWNSSESDSENKTGRPTNESKGEALTETGEQTADADANSDR